MSEIEDFNVERAILRNAPWDDVPVDPSRGSDPLWRTLNGARWFRHGDLDRALDCWLPAESDPRNGPLARTWAAFALARVGRHAEALERLTVASHLRGELRCAMGDVAGGLADMRSALAAAPQVEWRALRLAHWLRRVGQPEAAGTVLDERLTTPALYSVELQQAALEAWLLAGDPVRAFPHLLQIERRLPGLARRLVAGFAGFEPAASRLSASRRASARWLRPSLRSLVEDARVIPVSSRESLALRKLFERRESAPIGVLPGPSMWDALPDASNFRVFGHCVVRAPRSVQRDAAAMLLFRPGEAPDGPDSKRRDNIYLCFSANIPAFLWPSAPATAEGLTALLAPYARGLGGDDPQLGDLPHTFSVYLGAGSNYPVPDTRNGQLVRLDPMVFSRICAASPFVELPLWGSEHVDDPFQGFVDRDGRDLALATQAHQGMDRDRVRSVSYRLRWSRGVVELSEGPVGYALTVRYRANSHPGSVAAINTRFATEFPDDLPLDAIGVCMHFAGALGFEQLVESVSTNATLPAREGWRVAGLGMLGHAGPDLDRWLDESHPDLAPLAAPVAWSYGRLGWLLRLAQHMPQLRQPLQTGPHSEELSSGSVGSERQP